MLAGVETFEQVATECESDIHTLQEELTPLHSGLAEARRQRTELDIQVEALPNLKTERNAQTTAIAEQKKENTARQSTLDRLRVATTEMAEQVKKATQATLDTSLEQWRHYADGLDTAIQNVDAASEAAESGAGSRLTGALESWRADLHKRLEAFTPVRNATAAYRQRLAWLIGQGERPAEVDARALSVPDQRALLLSQAESIRGKRTGPVIGLVVALLMMVMSWGALWFLNYMPDHAVGQWLSNNLQLQVTHTTVLSLVAAVSSGLSLVLLVMVFMLTERMLTARQKAARLQTDQEDIKAQLQGLDSLSQQSLITEVATLEGCDDPQLKEALTRFVGGPGAALLDAEALAAFLAPLEAASRTCQEDAEALTRRITEEIRSGETHMAAIQQDLERLDQAITEEERRLNKAAQLDQEVAAFEKDIETKTHSIEVRRIAQNLLTGSHRRLLSRFNLEMRHVVSKIMPQTHRGTLRDHADR